ncbi:hypothetical protein RZS28_13555 [Methylocapsa polymorpha]|uniref:DUF805 domain-containing protein n=1 Tax=Methylocapsa polymorpha TaxID=3080828 RepID=A0ABZ0HNT1_9HYPH|nr:hypothetical protein RZS28_13555 [Methylocapsa sp. RX1]
MAEFLAEGGARFLFRTDQGRINARTWRRGTALLLAILIVLTAIWLPLEPLTHRDLATTPFFAWATVAAFAYLVLYAFAVLLIAICHYNLSAKRWRDRGWPGALAGLLPFFALLSGAAHWLQPRVAEVVPYWYVAGVDVLLVAVIVWNLVELGVFDRRSL